MVKGYERNNVPTAGYLTLPFHTQVSRRHIVPSHHIAPTTHDDRSIVPPVAPYIGRVDRTAPHDLSFSVPCGPVRVMTIQSIAAAPALIYDPFPQMILLAFGSGNWQQHYASVF